MKVIFTFSDSSTYESSIIRQGFSCQEILFNRLQASDGFVGFSIPFSTTFSNKMTADINNNVLAVVYDDNNNPYATGFVKKEVGYEQKYRNQPIKITIVSKSYMLDKTLNESYALESYTSAQIVTWLLTQAGISDIGSLSSMTTTVPLFVFNAGENVKDVLKEFCFEYSKTFYFDKNGYFQVADLFISSFTASQTFDRSNIRDRVNINVKEAEANCIRGRWTPLSLVSDTLVFEDKQNATSQYDCVIPIAANSWFGGVEDNFLKCDSTLGEVKYVKSISQNNIQSDSGITKTLDLLERTSLNQLHFTAKNTTASVKNITKMQVYANAYIAKENRVDVTTYGNKEKELSLKYIQDQTTAQNFVKALADYYNSTSFTVSFSSDEVCDIGDLVTVSADGIGSFNCRIIQRTRNIITDTIDYVCENIGDYTPAVIVQTVQEPLAVNIAGGQKGLDGAPGTPGADGKNAITMTSATTPSGKYNGQMGFWQGQPYMWNGSSWVKQIGDLPTDSVLHYSFDDVPDYPDGSADVRLLDNNTYDIQSTNYQFRLWRGTTVTNSNGNVLLTLSASSEGQSGVYINGSYITNKIVKIKLKINSMTSSIDIYNGKGTGEEIVERFTKIGVYEFSLIINSNAQYPNLFITTTNTNESAEIEILDIYIGDGSYSTPIIDNANGQWNSISQSGVVTKGVSGKAIQCFNGNGVNIGNFNFNTDFTISLWVNPNDVANELKTIMLKENVLAFYNGIASDNVIQYVLLQNGTVVRQNFSTRLPANKYTHLVLSKSGTTMKAYVDGTLANTKTLTTSVVDQNSNSLYLGRTDGFGAVKSKFDDLLIFSRALSDTEVLALYQNKANTPKYYDLSDYIVEGIDDDGIISPSEKEILYQKWIDIYAVLNGTAITASSTGQGGEYGKMISRATTAGVSLVTTGGEGKAYVDATEALRAGLWTTAYLQNMSVQTKVSAGTIDTLFNNYRTAYEALSIAIDVQNKATASALSISQSNSYHQVPTNSSGTPLSYVGTDNTVYLLEGSSKLTCVATGTTLSAGKWKITNITMTGCTSGTTKDNYTISDNGAVLGVLTGMTEQSAKRTLTIQFMGNNASTAETITVVQSFAKSQAGADGSTYKLLASANCVKTNTSVRFDAKKIVGSGVSNFADGYLYSSTDGTTWTARGQFKNGSAYASKNISVSVDTIFRLCLTESPSTNLVDELSVNIYRDGDTGPQGPQGDTGANGVSSTNVILGNENITLNCNSNGLTKSAFSIQINIGAYLGSSRIASTITVTNNFSNLAVGTITNGTTSSDGIIPLSIDYGSLVTYNAGIIEVTVVANGITFKKYINVTKTVDGTKGNQGTKGDFTKLIPLYYVGNSSTAPSAPSSRVTSTSTATTTTWTQGIYNTYAVGKYYYTCEQIEVYNNAGTYQSCSWSAVSRHTEYENASIAKLRSAGQYKGTKSASFTAYTGSDNWDWFLATENFTQQSVSIVAGNVYVWNGTTWTRDTDTSHLSATMKDMMALIDSYTTGSTDIATYATVLAQTLAVQQAFINKLMLNKLKLVQNGNDIGAIYGGKYNEDGSVDPQSTATKGVYLDAEGTLKGYDCEFDNVSTTNLVRKIELNAGGKYFCTLRDVMTTMTTSDSLDVTYTLKNIKGYVRVYARAYYQGTDSDFYPLTGQIKINNEGWTSGSSRTQDIQITGNTEIKIQFKPTATQNRAVVLYVSLGCNYSDSILQNLTEEIQSHITGYVGINNPVASWAITSFFGNNVKAYSRINISERFAATDGDYKQIPSPICSWFEPTDYKYETTIKELSMTPFSSSDGGICGVESDSTIGFSYIIPIFYANKNISASVWFDSIFMNLTGRMALNYSYYS